MWRDLANNQIPPTNDNRAGGGEGGEAMMGIDNDNNNDDEGGRGVAVVASVSAGERSRGGPMQRQHAASAGGIVAIATAALLAPGRILCRRHRIFEQGGGVRPPLHLPRRCHGNVVDGGMEGRAEGNSAAVPYPQAAGNQGR